MTNIKLKLHILTSVSQLGVDFMEGRKTGELGEKPSKYGGERLRKLYSHKSQV